MNRLIPYLTSFAIVFMVGIFPVLAHEEVEVTPQSDTITTQELDSPEAGTVDVLYSDPAPTSTVIDGTNDLEHASALFSRNMAYVGFGLVCGLILIAILTAGKKNAPKRLLFTCISLVVVTTTFSLVWSTVSLNRTSWTKGPIHWHADFEIWNCGTEITLKDPQGKFSNKIGTASLHEHNDKRIHYEGVVVSPAHAMLANFFRVVGGQLTNSSLTVPTNEGLVTMTSGNRCPTGESKLAELQLFAYTANPDGTYQQRKIDTPAEYVMSQHSQVPPGDCLILEFAPSMDHTHHLCKSYQVAEEIGKIRGVTDDGN